MLGQQAAVRFGGDCEGDKTYCEVFGIVTNAQQCERCKADPEFRAFLYGQAVARGAGKERAVDCKHRGKAIRTEMRICCGGQEKEIEIFECPLNGEASEAICVICARRTGA